MNANPTMTLHVPRLGEGLFEVRIVALFKKPGDTVREDEVIYELESDKATVSIESPQRGKLVAWHVAEGDVIRVGTAIAEIDVSVESPSELQPALPKDAVEVVEVAEVRPAFVPPRTRAYARAKGLSPDEWSMIPAAGERLTTEDVDRFLASRGAEKSPPKEPVQSNGLANGRSETEEKVQEASESVRPKQGEGWREKPVSKAQRMLIHRMRRSQALVIPCTMMARVTVEGLALGGRHLLERAGADSRKHFLSTFQVFAYAVARVVRMAPLFRSQMVADDACREHETLNLGVAVHTPKDELLIALVERADHLDFPAFVERFQERVEAALAGQDQATESMQLVLSCLGETRISGGTPLLVAPAAAVLAYGEIVGEPGVAQLSLTFDHRLIQGMQATRFLEQISQKVAEIRATEPVLVTSVVEHPFSSNGHLIENGTVGSTDALALVLEKLAQVLGVDPSSVDPVEALGAQGIDSIKAMALKEALDRYFGSDIPATLVWRYPTASAIAGYLSREFPTHIHVQTQTKASVPASNGSPTPVLAPKFSNGKLEPILSRDPVAIVGLSFRFPGGLETLDEFWAFLANGSTAIRRAPMDRFQGEDREESEGLWWGGFLEGVDRFDAGFFNLSRREAERMDPQHRLFLQAVWHAMEDAGCAPESLSGTKTGVFVGVSNHDYLGLLKAHGARDAHSAIGVSPSLLSNRVSFLLNLHGPSQTLDTACSSSLVALHQALQSIRLGESDQAFVGGVNLLLSLDHFKAFRDAGMLATDGKCKTFDDSADGYVRGEGIAAILIKPLSAALRDGNPIYGLLLGSAVNHGGRANSLTAPNPEAQGELLTAAFKSAGVKASTIGYLEAHGTGTRLGDPIEVEALRAAFEGGAGGSEFGTKAPAAYCGLGSVKPNLGHLEASAGLAGLIKVLACFKQRKLPPSVHLEKLNRHIRLDGSPFYLLKENAEWKPPCDAHGNPLPRRAGVSSFGFGGVNAHVVLEEFAKERSLKYPGNPGRPELIVLSAKTGTQLGEAAQRLLASLSGDNSASLAEIAYTLQTGRAALRHRLAFVVHDLVELRRRLETFVGGTRNSHDLFIGELGGGRELGGVASRAPVWVESHRVPKEEEWQEVGKQWVGGSVVDWNLYWSERRPRHISLPGYPFACDSYWIDTSEALPVKPVAPEQVMPNNNDTSMEEMLLCPIWEVQTITAGQQAPSPLERVAVVGGTVQQLAAIQACCTRAVSLPIGAGDTLAVLGQKISAVGAIDHVIWIAPRPSFGGVADSRIIEDQGAGVLLYFRVAKALLALGYAERPLGWTVITQQTEALSPSESSDPTHAGLHGLAGNLAREHVLWPIRLADLPAYGEWPMAELLSLPQDANGNGWFYREGQWRRRQMLSVQATSGSNSLYKRGGTYVIAGGGGGIGTVWTEYMIRTYQARVLWIGRRPMNPELREQVDRLGRLGTPPEYYQADITDRESLRRAYAEIKARHPEIHGVVHSAVGAIDRSVAGMDEQRFRSALAVKVDGAVYLCQVFRDEPLDFVLFFSSFASFVSDPGKSSYAAGCVFGDTFARRLGRDLGCAVKVVNWGYWGDVGVGRHIPQAVKNRLRQSGIGVISSVAGMAALETLLAREMNQLVVLTAARPLNWEGFNTRESFKWVAGELPALAGALSAPTSVTVQRHSNTARIEAACERALGQVLLAQLQAVGLLAAPRTSRSELQLPISAPAWLGRWLEHTLPLLAVQGWIKVEVDAVSVLQPEVDSRLAWVEWNTAKSAALGDPSLSPWMSAVDAVLHALPGILTGRVQGTEVLFPQASMERVEAIYKGNPIADYFNSVLADTVANYIQLRLRQDPNARFRLLEIGAGTGATTRAVLHALAPHSRQVAEYRFTDLSKAFLLRAETELRADAPWLVCSRFDVESEVEAQGIPEGEYDIVIAANVLHATRNILHTLRHAKFPLKRNGLLLLNEVSRKSIFQQLTFGLLEGWWLYEDPGVRLPGSPGLASTSWQNVLEAEGFRNISFPAREAHDLGQQIVIAESDGILRVKGDSVESAAPVTEAVRAEPTPIVASTPALKARETVPSLSQHLDHEGLRQKSIGFFRKLVADTLKMPVQKVDPSTPLESYGIDSILTVQMTSRLRKDFPGLSGTVFFEVQNVAELTDYFIRTKREELARFLGIGSPGVDITPKVEPAISPTPVPPVVESASFSWPAALPPAVPLPPGDLQGVAIIGVSICFPDAADLDTFWENLKAGRDSITEIPADRWSTEGFFEPDVKKAVREGKSYSKWGGFIDGFADFDPLFFNISPREAITMDPQERLFLEHSWRALEDAGYTREQLASRYQGRVGVFAGVTAHEFDCYAPEFWKQPEPTYICSSFCSIPNRVSYHLNLHGPSMPLDTMCSASLTAIHEACEQLRRGSCEMAIAGAAHVNVHPSGFISLCAKGMLSTENKCRSFGKGASGFVRGEGVGVLILKPLSKAVADGDSIYGVIRSARLNHGGKTNGFNVPNPLAQKDLIREALKYAGVSARSVTCLEAHGTGTDLGDPIEISGLTQAFQIDTTENQFCALGSVKSNFGHLEAAAGMAGVVKVLLQMQHGEFVPSLHSAEPNPEVDFSQTPFFIPQGVAEWKRPILDNAGVLREYPRIAGISSFGGGGSNAHVIIEEYLAPLTAGPVAAPTGPWMIVLSAKSQASLRQVAENLVSFLRRHGEDAIDLANVAYTLQIGREAMDERVAMVVGSVLQLLEKLSGFLQGANEPEELYSGSARSGSEMSAIFDSDDDLRQVMETLIDKRKYGKILALWVKGVRVNWDRLYVGASPRRVRLPTYPFARRRFWLPEPATPPTKQAAPVAPPETLANGPTQGASDSEMSKPARDLSYLMRWEVRPVAKSKPVEPSHGTVLIVSTADSFRFDEAVADVYRSCPETKRILRIRLAQETRKLSEDDWAYDCRDAHGFSTCLAGVGKIDGFYFIGLGQSTMGKNLAGDLALLAAGESTHEVSFFRWVRYLQSSGHLASAIDTYVLTRDAFRLGGGEVNPVGAGLTGLACSVAQHDKRFLVRNLDLSIEDLGEWGRHRMLAAEILKEPASDRGSVVKFREGEVYRRVFLPVRVADSATGVEPTDDRGLRKGGVYVVVGGAGTIGRIITRRLIEKYQTRVIWLGRKSADSESIRDARESFRTCGELPSYFQADITDYASMRNALREIGKAFPVLHGAIFSAVVSAESKAIDQTTEADFRKIFETKSRGAVVFHKVFHGMVADFLCYFSSIQSFFFTSSKDSAAYATGITYADAFQQWAETRSKTPVGAIHWGYWRSSAEGTELGARLGSRFGLIGDDEGFAAFERFIRHLRGGILKGAICVDASEAVQTLMSAGATDTLLIHGKKNVPLIASFQVRPEVFDDSSRLSSSRLDGEVDRWLRRLLRAQLRELGVMPTLHDGRVSEADCLGAGLAPRYARWWTECLRLLSLEGNGDVVPVGSEWSAWRLNRDRFMADSTQNARLALTEECLRNLPGILRGSIVAADILFPGSSMDRVENIYKNNPTADYFNRTVADAVVYLVSQRLQADPGAKIRILEIGAGTGGTSAVVLKALKPFSASLHYDYTDISKAFLLFAQDHYGAESPFLHYHLCNIELPLADQGLEPGTYDIVLSTNAVHATRNIRRSLRNAKSALVRNGVLLLNEVTRNNVFQFLTFGLLDGWWLYEDESIRMPGSPVLSAKSWEKVLTDEGFCQIGFPLAAAASLDQQLIVAESDGLIRISPVTAAASVQAAQAAVREAFQQNGANGDSILVQAPQRLAVEAGESAEDLPLRVEGAINDCLASTLRLSQSEINREIPFSDYGIDSILSGTFLDKLNEALGLSLNATVIYDHTTVARLARHVIASFDKSVLSRRTKKEPAQAVMEVRVARSQSIGANPVESPRIHPAPSPMELAPVPLPPKARQTGSGLEIAIIGISAQAPDARDVDEFWRNLISGHDAIRELPPHYLDITRDFHPDKKPGKAYCKRGGILEDRDCFDPLFFNLSPREAESMNPHQRLVMQEGWKALEDAGYNPKGLAEEMVGLFVGSEPTGYFNGTLSGFSDAIVASRLSYHLNLNGPALAVNTGCSSSAVAIHLACKSLRDGESRMALAGGVFAVMDSDLLIRMCQVEMLSKTGQCHTFDKSADGTVLSEGVGMLVLKRLEDAIADEDTIYGVICASGMNQDGASNGITAPNGAAQERLMVDVYRRFGIDPAGISYVETHGTGTRLGDPVEGNALVRAFGKFTAKKEFCAIGSSKAHIGHAAAAAGAIGLIKILLSMRYRQLPGLLHFQDLNPAVELENSAFYIQRRTTDWKTEDGMPRMAALSAFGHSGTNVHLVVREHPAPENRAERVGWRGRPLGKDNRILVPLSARTPEALVANAARLRDFLSRQPESTMSLADIAYTCQVGREAMERKALCVVGNHPEFLAQLDRIAQGSATPSPDHGADAELARIGDAWLAGKSVDWSTLYTGTRPRRTHLPTYPFARERYWKPLAARPSVSPTAQEILGAATSPGYRRVLNGDEFFLTDHVIGGRRMLPAVMLMELAREAVVKHLGQRLSATVVTLENVAWIRPVVFEGRPISLRVEVSPVDSERCTFEIASELGDGNWLIHSSGQARSETSAESPRLDLDILRVRFGEPVLPGRCYELFSQLGVQYGPAFKALDKVWTGPQGVVAKLVLPAACRGTLQEFVLHPSLLDGSWQGSVGLNPSSHGLPFAVARVDIYGRCTDSMWAWVRPVEAPRGQSSISSLDVDLCNEQGAVCVRVRGLTGRIPKNNVSPETTATSGSVVLQPCWTDRAVDMSAQSARDLDKVAILVELGSVARETVQAALPGWCFLALDSTDAPIEIRFESHALRLLEEIRNRLSGGLRRDTLVQLAVPTGDERRLFTSLFGVLLSARQENPRLLVQLLEIDDEPAAETLVAILPQNAATPLEARVRYQDRKRQAGSWSELLPVTQPVRPLWKDRGVYLITGGGGGLGLLFAEEIARTVRDATIVLAGRSPETPRLAERLGQLKPSAQVVYRTADIGKASDVEGLVAGIRRDFGRLDGILHAAGVLRDSFILKKTTEEFHEVLTPKSAGAVYLDRATCDLDLDFFVLFSSVAAVIGNVGQSDYACGNAFLDAFANYRNELIQSGTRRGWTLSVNWPLWKEGGMQLLSAKEKWLEETMGMMAMDTSAGMEALRWAFAARVNQVMVLQGDAPRLRMAFLSPTVGEPIGEIENRQESVEVDAARLRDPAVGYIKRLLASALKLSPGRIDDDAQWDRYGIDSVLAMEVTNDLEKAFGPLPKTLFFEYLTPRSLAGYFLDAHRSRLVSLLPESVAPKPRPAAPLKQTEVAHISALALGIPRVELSPAADSAPRPVRTPSSNQRDIAIIGVSGRYPQARNLGEFWTNLKSGRDCITEVPADRWDHSRYFTTDPNQPGKTYSKWGGFLDGVDRFDPLFFNISPREAALLDPQERLFLQCAYETVEDAGYTAASLGRDATGQSDRRIGVYVGVMYEEYQFHGVEETMRGRPVALIGSPASIANRVSYFFDFNGPSVAVDTMCSSSLMALHLACQSLQRGECRLAIAGGVNVSVHPNKYLMLAQGKFVSSKGRCESFGQGAEGYVPGEGVGSVLLKPLEQAVADGDRIYGIVKGTSVNHGGRTHGYTVPNPNAQADVIARAWREANVDPRTISYIEAHGTGTSLGDPVEVAGLVKAFETCTKERQFCALGSVKSNIGHCESAAGIAALTKVLLQLEHRQLAPSLHASVLNPNIDFSRTPFVVQQSLAEWKSPAGVPRRAGISSFGAGGSNAHVLIEEWQGTSKSRVPIAREGGHLIVLSAKNEERLLAVAQRLLEAIGETDPALADVAYTLQIGRETMDERLAFAVDSVEACHGTLRRIAAGEKEIEGVHRGNIKKHRESVGALASDEEMSQLLAGWLAKGKHDKVLDLWTKGLHVDWRGLYRDGLPRRIRLPAYPFASERCWFDSAKSVVAEPSVPVLPAPLEPDREPRLLEKRWQASPISGATVEASTGFVIIVANADTLALADHVAARIAFTRVIQTSRLGMEPPLLKDEWKNCLGWIDLVGCGSREGGSLDWIPWLQHCVEFGSREGLVLLAVTKGLETFRNPTSNLTGATRAGLFRMLQSEYRHLQSRHLDLADSDIGTLASQIVAEFRSNAEDVEVCYRDGLRYIAYLDEASVRPGPAAPVAFPQDQVLWITGGTRGLGSLCARHFVERHGVRRLVLTGVEPLAPRGQWPVLRMDQGPKGERVRTVEALELAGAEVRVLNVSLSDPVALRECAQQVRRDFGPIGGVLHCAGLADMANPAWVRKSAAGIERILAPKVAGLDHLISAMEAEPVQFLVLFSSVSAIVPSLAAGQGDYSMANAYMDYVAGAHASSIPILSLQWPSWKESGVGEAKSAAYQQSGLCSLTDAEGLAWLDRVLASGKTGVLMPAIVRTTNWKPESLMRRTAPVVGAGKSSPAKVAPEPGLASMGQPGDVETATRIWLKGLFSKELHMDVSRIEDATPFPDYGLDSVLLAQVLRQMSDQVGAALDPSLLLEHSTIDGLTQWFLKHHRAALATLHAGFARPAADTAKTPGDPIVQPSRNVAPEATQGAPLAVLSRDVAVIGLSCRFPGAPTLEAFWQLLCDGRSAIGSVPRERWGTVVSFPAALLEDVTRFDPAHFHISDEDAQAMDPQAFLLLEESLKALHHAGYTPKELKKLPVGVYIGARSQRVADEASLKAAPNPIRAAGPNYLAAGISQFFDLRGPSLVVDSACSSALVAMNMAVQALQLGEITSAFVGGVGLLADDKAHRLFEQRGILAKEKAFHLFDQRASGVVLGEGSGMVILKLLDHAIRDGDRIYSVIKGLAINNDGRSAGPATPNLEAQVAVMRAGLAKSGRKPEEVQYIEVNGSGSEVTDLLELKALQAVYRDSNATPCALGSIKPNIGHPLCAEGIAGFIKAALMVWKGRHVPFLSGQVPMTHFDLTSSPFYFSRGTTEWAGRSRLAAVNCFADGGTNAHVILESWEQGSQMPSRAPLPPPEWHRKEVFVPAPAGLSAAGAPGSVKSSGNGNGNGNGHHGNGNGSGNGYGNGHHGKGDGMGNGKAQQHAPTSTKAAPVMAAGNRWRRSY